VGGHRVHRFDGDEPEIQRNRDGERPTVVAGGGVVAVTMCVVPMHMLIMCMLLI
jgi:hypothetical protein